MSIIRAAVLSIGVLYFFTDPISAENPMGGPADLQIKSFDQCPDPDQYKYKMTLVRHKLNRTHEAFDGSSKLGFDVDDDVSIYVNVAKKANDGYKPNAFEFRDVSACKFLMKWVGKSFQEILAKIGQPETCPVKAGSYSLENFIIDFRTLPQTLPYGDFRADMYLIKNGENLMCFQVFLITKPKKLFN